MVNIIIIGEYNMIWRKMVRCLVVQSPNQKINQKSFQQPNIYSTAYIIQKAINQTIDKQVDYNRVVTQRYLI